jgi:phenol/toluene 2-monooxygenase (NADH) P0/A0
MPMPSASAHQAEVPPLDTTLRFVRVRHRRPNGLVEFDFAIGEPELFVEMILPAAAFTDFCATQQAVVLPDEPTPAEAPKDDWDWRMTDATHTRFK